MSMSAESATIMTSIALVFGIAMGMIIFYVILKLAWNLREQSG